MLIKSRELIQCGSLQFKGEAYEVYLESPDSLVWLAKTNEPSLKFENYSNERAFDHLDAIRIAVQTLKAKRLEPA